MGDRDRMQGTRGWQSSRDSERDSGERREDEDRRERGRGNERRRDSPEQYREWRERDDSRGNGPRGPYGSRNNERYDERGDSRGGSSGGYGDGRYRDDQQKYDGQRQYGEKRDRDGPRWNVSTQVSVVVRRERGPEGQHDVRHEQRGKGGGRYDDGRHHGGPVRYGRKHESIITEDAARGAPRESDATEHEGLTKLEPNATGESNGAVTREGGDEGAGRITKLEPNAVV